MKRIAILVIAAVNQPVYVHYINSYWAKVIEYTNANKLNTDIFLLFEHDTDISEFKNLEENIIQDRNSDYSQLCDIQYHTINIPGILSKTIFALDSILNEYDVFFRTNLSSIIKISDFERFVQNRNNICYSGTYVWVNALRQNLMHYNNIGASESIKSLAELDGYDSNTFISGCGYFLNSLEAKSLVDRNDEIRYDLPDDVSVGLMLPKHELLPEFSLTVSRTGNEYEIMSAIRQTDASHIRLDHFPLSKAEALWNLLEHDEIWK